MKKNRILAIVMCLIAAVACFGFAACNNNNTDGGKHNFATTWSADNDYHWHECTDEGCTEVSDKEAHSFENNVCKVCGRTDTASLTITDLYVNLVKSVADVKASEGFGTAIKNATVSLKGTDDMAISIITDDANGDIDIIPDMEVVANAEVFVGRDADGDFVLYVTANLNADAKKSAKNTADLTAFADVFTTSNVSANVIIEKGVVYVAAEVNVAYDGIPDEYKEFNKEDPQTFKYSAKVEDLVKMFIHTDELPGWVGASIEIVKGLLPEITEKVNTEIVPAIEKAIAENKAVLDEYLEKIIKNQYKVTEKDGKKVITLDYDKVKKSIDDMMDLTVGEFYDKYVGEGSYDNMVTAINGLLDMKVKTFIIAAEGAIGMDLNEIAVEINKVIAKIAPEEEVNTIEALIGVPEGSTFRDYVFGMVEEMTFGDLIMKFADPNGTSEKTINEIVAEAFATVKAQGMYECMLTAMNTVSGGKLPIEQMLSMKETVRTTAKGMIDLMAKACNVELGLDYDGTFSYLSVKLTLNKEILETICGFAGADTASMPEMTASVSFSVYKGAFKNELNTDYAKVIKDIQDYMNGQSEEAAA